MNKNGLRMIVLLLFALSGCSATLANEKTTFEGAGHSYEFKLPDSWKAQEPSVYKNNFGDSAVFGAEDEKSDSFMYILTFPKEDIILDGFGEKTREDLQKVHGYKNIEDVFMKEYEVNGYSAFKYTVNTIYKDDSIWVHLYYFITENSVVQINYYSADDRNYEKRVEILNESADSLKETGEAATETEESTTEIENSHLSTENDQFRFDVTGYRKITVADQEYLAVRFTLLNKTDMVVTPELWYEKARLMQGEDTLSQTEFPDDAEAANLKELAMTNGEEILKGQEQEGLAFYKVSSDENERIVSVLFNEDEFERDQEIQLDLSTFDE